MISERRRPVAEGGGTVEKSAFPGNEAAVNPRVRHYRVARDSLETKSIRTGTGASNAGTHEYRAISPLSHEKAFYELMLNINKLCTFAALTYTLLCRMRSIPDFDPYVTSVDRKF